MLPCCCDSSSQGSQVNFQPHNDRTAYDYAHAGGSVPAAGGPEASEPFAASLPEPPTYEAGDEAGVPLPPVPASDAESPPAKGEVEKPEDRAAPVPPTPQDGAVGPASDQPPANTGRSQPSANGMDKEKMRLQDLVKDFAKRAMIGVSCGLVDLDSGSVRQATYLVDRQLQKLIVKIDEQGEAPAAEETRHIGSISEVFVRTAGVEKLTPQAAAALDDASKDKLVLMTFASGSLCLIENTAEEATSFAVCMRVLHVYCKQKGLS